MQSIDELKETLASAGAQAGGRLSPTDRLAAVRRRAHVVRRRRQAGVASLAAAAVLAVVGANVSGLLPGLHRADSEIAAGHGGFAPPPSLVSLGYTYSFVASESGTQWVAFDLPASNEPRLVSWAVPEGQQATLTVDRGDGSSLNHPVLAGEFGDFVYIFPGQRLNVLLTAQRGSDAAVALAVYELDGAGPPGVTAAGITYRNDVAGRELLGARIGDLGQDTLSFKVPLSAELTGLALAPLCAGQAGSYEVWINGEVMLGEGRCGADPAFDPGVPAAVLDSAYPAGTVLHVSMRAKGESGSSAPFAGRLGLGLYDGSDRAPLAQRIEQGGHTWDLVKVVNGRLGDAGHTLPPAAQRLAIRVFIPGNRRVAWAVELNGKVVARTRQGPESFMTATTWDSEIWPSEGTHLRLLPGRPDPGPTPYRLGVYSMVE